MTNFKTFLPALLALLLLFSQQMVLTHSVSHLSQAPVAGAHTKSLPLDQTCETCLAYAQVGSGMPSQFALRLADAVPEIGFVSSFIAFRSVVRFTAFRTRAPPQS